MVLTTQALTISLRKDQIDKLNQMKDRSKAVQRMIDFYFKMRSEQTNHLTPEQVNYLVSIRKRINQGEGLSLLPAALNAYNSNFKKDLNEREFYNLMDQIRNKVKELKNE